MRGHIRKRGNKFVVVVSLGRNEHGKPIQKWFSGFDTRQQAEAAASKIVHEINTGLYVEPTKLTVGEYLLQWMENYARVNVSPKTADRYEEMIRQHIIPYMGRILLQKLHPLQIQTFYAHEIKHGRLKGDKPLAARTVLHFHRVLREALHHAVKWQILARNPADAVDPPRPQYHEMKVLDDRQMAYILHFGNGRLVYIPILLAGTTGMRRGEIVALQWKDINLNRATVTVRRSCERIQGGYRFKEPKSMTSRRLVILPAMTVEALVEHKAKQNEEKRRAGAGYKDRDLVSAWPDGTMIKPDYVSREFRKILKELRLPLVRFHDLRHTHATHLMMQGVHPKVVSERLGHSSTRITMDLYTHVMPSLQKEAAEQVDSYLRNAMEKNQVGPSSIGMIKLDRGFFNPSNDQPFTNIDG